MKCSDISCVELPPYMWREQKPVVRKDVQVGWDTETYQGYCGLLTNSDGGTLLHFEGDYGKLFKFMRPYAGTKSANFFYNLDFDTMAMLKFMPVDCLRTLKETNEVIYQGIHFFYIPKKVFKIGQGSHVVTFWDIAQFYRKDGRIPHLREAAKTVGMEKMDENVRDNRREDMPRLVEYCVQDSRITQALAERFVTLVRRAVPANRWYSHAAIARRAVLTMPGLPRMQRDLRLLGFALRAYHGGRFETFMKGTFPKWVNHDINSAYPYEISRLVDCGGRLVINREYEPDAKHSFFRVDVKVGDCHIAPLAMFRKFLIFPTGAIRDTYITKSEYEYLQERGCRMHIHKAVHIMGRESNCPFEWVSEWYQERQRLKAADDSLEEIYKIIPNSLYGCFIMMTACSETDEEMPEERWEPHGGQMMSRFLRYRAGMLYAPYWAAEITAGTRLTLLKAVEGDEDSVISFATDGIYSTRPLRVRESDRLGAWKVRKCESPLTIVGGGVYSSGEKGKFRGFGTVRKVGDETRPLLLHELLAEQEGTRLEYMRERPMRLSECLVQARPEDINVFSLQTKVLDINMDRKRVWERDFRDTRDVLENVIMSRPHFVR